MSTRILTGDCRETLKTLADGSVHCCVTSPPYWNLRDYGVDGQIGLEPTPEEFVAELLGVFREVRRVLRDDGTCWVNLGDSYAGSYGAQGRPTTTADNEDRCTLTGGSTRAARRIAAAPRLSLGRVKNTPGLKPKDLCGVPWRVAFALQADGWYLRSDIVWHKPNPMPESTTDRPTKAHEYIFLLSKSASYHYDADAIREPHQDKAGPPSRFGAKGQTNASVKQDGTGLARSRMQSNVPPVDGYNPLGRNRRTVWTIPSEPYPDAHFATFPTALVQPCILAGCPEGGTVLDPFGGSGTVGEVAATLGRHAILCELNPAYVALAEKRTAQESLFASAGVSK